MTELGSIGSIGKQSGAVMLALMLVLLTGSSYLSLTNFNANSIKVSSATKTSKALKSAKQSLLSYAVSYPDLGNDGGPGYLPCPDITNDGIAGGNCSYAGGTTIGYFPFKTLDTQELRDGNGNRLWYVISERYRYGSSKTEPMNSDIADDSVNNLDLNIDNNPTTSTDNIDNIVAIIIAPGVPLSGQTRTGNASDAENLNPDNYLEGENADGDQIYMTIRSVLRNDRLVLITRDELMAAVERRVMGDIATALQRYRATYNALPWLSPFADPAASTFHSEPGVNGYTGHLPFHWSGDEPGSTNRNPFDTRIAWTWHTDIGTATGNYSGTVTPDCLRNVDCDDGLFPPISEVNTNSIECIWSDKITVNCAQSGWIAMTDTNCSSGCPNNGKCTRYYNIKFPEYEGTQVGINAPDESTSRTRKVILNGSLEEQSRAVEIFDVYSGPVLPYCTTDSFVIGEGHINFTINTTGSMTSSAIKYDLDVDSGELPEWFVKNRWYELVYMAYAKGEPYPGITTLSDPCSKTTVTCLDVDYITPYDTANVGDIRALIIMAGRKLPDQDRTTPSLSQYLEGKNEDGDQNFVINTDNININDLLKVVLEN